MWNERDQLLAAVIFTALCYSAAELVPQLVIDPDSVDYHYDNCHEEFMKKLIYSGDLEQELAQSVEFQNAWHSKNSCLEKIPNETRNHTLALMAIAEEQDPFMDFFNNEVDKMGANISTYENNFHYKSLHFLLMDYMRLQNTSECLTVYYMLDKPYEAKPGSNVTLGKFLRTVTDLNKLVDIDEPQVLNITSCMFVKMVDNNCAKDHGLILLSPAEVFTVESVEDKSDYDTEYTQIVLKHSGVKHSDICDIFSRNDAVLLTATEGGEGEQELQKDIWVELRDLRDMVVVQAVQLSQLTARVTAAENLVEDLKNGNAAMEARMTAAESLVEELKMGNDAQNKELEVNKEKLSNLQMRLTATESKMEALKKQQEGQNVAVQEL